MPMTIRLANSSPNRKIICPRRAKHPVIKLLV
jgi:hypothetical protein